MKMRNYICESKKTILYQNVNFDKLTITNYFKAVCQIHVKITSFNKIN